MLKLSKKCDYGLLLLTELARRDEGKYSSLRQVAEKLNVPYKFASQIMLELKKRGLVKSREGVTGGYRLAREARDINLMDAVEALEGPVAPVGCMRREECKNKEVCGHSGVMKRLAEVVEETLRHSSLADLC